MIGAADWPQHQVICEPAPQTDTMADFTGKVAIVTGASSGIGAAIAVSLAGNGCHLTITGRNTDGLNDTKQKVLQAGLHPQHLHLVQADLLDKHQVQLVYDKSMEFHQKLDILINNAGVTHLDVMDNSLDKYHEVMQINLGAIVHLTQSCQSELIKSRGCILNISSCCGTMPMANAQAYSTSKAGLDHYMRCKALELAEFGVRVNNISPAGVDTQIMVRAGLPPDMVKMWRDWGHRQFQALDRPMATPEEVASVASFLVSERAGWSTGVNVMVDAGASCMCITPDPVQAK